MVLEIARPDFALFLTFPTPNPMLGSKSFRSMNPTKFGFLRLNKVLGIKKISTFTAHYCHFANKDSVLSCTVNSKCVVTGHMLYSASLIHIQCTFIVYYPCRN